MPAALSGRAPVRLALAGACVALSLSPSRTSLARPNTHAPAISTWDSRASSVVLGLGRAVSGDGDYTSTSYNANFSSTSGTLSAQFGAHYLTYGVGESSGEARGFSAGGVALISLPLTERREDGLPGSAFAFYVGGIPTALFSGQRNFISIPLVIGLGVPISPASVVTFSPWVELSPGLDFDTRIQEVSTEEAIQAAMDGTLTQAEVEDLVEQGLVINRGTSVGKRAGLALELHLGRDVDLDAHVTLGVGHASAIGLGAALVFRWDDMVPGVKPAAADTAELDCAALEARLRACPAARRQPARAGRQPAPPSARDVPARRRSAPQRRATQPPVPRAAPPTRPPERGTAPPGSPAPRPPASSKTKRGKAPSTSTSSPRPAGAAPKARPDVLELPPLQAAPPRRN